MHYYIQLTFDTDALYVVQKHMPRLSCQGRAVVQTFAGHGVGSNQMVLSVPQDHLQFFLAHEHVELDDNVRVIDVRVVRAGLAHPTDKPKLWTSLRTAVKTWWDPPEPYHYVDDVGHMRVD